MIRYDLICDKGHKFDGWFADSTAYDKQARRKLVTCIHCGSTKVEKQLMSPGIPGKSNRKADAQPQMFTPGDAKQRKLLQVMREIRKSVEENSEYVGKRFAEEARKIHYEEAEKRGIHGEATAEDAKALIEEGIEVHPLPTLPEEGN
jgi:hypothetical protein